MLNNMKKNMWQQCTYYGRNSLILVATAIEDIRHGMSRGKYFKSQR